MTYIMVHHRADKKTIKASMETIFVALFVLSEELTLFSHTNKQEFLQNFNAGHRRSSQKYHNV